MKRILTWLGLWLGLMTSASGQVEFVPTNALWLYVADGSDLGTEWRATFFNDSEWRFGLAQLGWGEGDENTALLSGPSVTNAPVTTYFRTTFHLAQPFAVFSLRLRVMGDDGVVVYLNGTEVGRNNLPAGPVDFLTPASSDITSNESAYTQFSVPPALLIPGPNTVAAELHQSAAGRADGSFDLELIGNLPNARPQIVLASPPDGVTFSDGAVAISAEASDPDGQVTRVDYFADTTFLGFATQTPFLLNTRLATGRHRLHGVARDNTGFTTASPNVHVQVGNELPVNLARGPYLQSGTPGSMMVRWRTDWPTNSVVRYGTNLGALNAVATLPGRTSEHQALITGLRADTKYYYEVGSTTEWMTGGSGSFRTSPTNPRPVSVWVIGDSGLPGANADSVRDAYVNALGPENTDLWLMLGDNAYGSGTDAEYQAAVFDTYPDILRHLPVWPTLGNHDAESIGLAGKFPYFDIFTLPTAGEAGGVPSGTEHYYSFDYANIHFICLDSQSSVRTAGSPMLVWLKEDLAATDKDWIVAFWHHPAYSWGTHDSDGETALIEMREHAVPILEAYGVDLVLAGHSHVYERSFLLNGHHGYSYTLTTNMILDASRGNDADAGPYRKPAGGLGANRGAVYAVCGCSGQGEEGWDFQRHPAMATNMWGFGSMILNFDGLRLNARFLRPGGAVEDEFSIDKSQPTTLPPQLEVARTAGGISLAWPTSVPAYSLETASFVATNVAWQGTTNYSTRVGRRNVVNLDSSSGVEFFRLRAGP